MKHLVGFVTFLAVWLVGAAFGIRPTIAEGLLVIASVTALQIAEALYTRRRRPKPQAPSGG